MLTDKQLFEVKKAAGFRVIAELGLASFSNDSLWGDCTEEVAFIVHDEMMKLLVRLTGTVRVYGDSILDQEWDLIRDLLTDLEKVADLYLSGKIRIALSAL